MAYTPINKGQFTLETPEREAMFEKNRGFGVEDFYRENRRLWNDLPRWQHVADYPLHVDIELSTVCNLRCPMCYTITREFRTKVKPTLMEFDLFKKIVDECKAGDVYSIRLSFRGESFLHPRIVDSVRYAKERGIKEVSTLTNGYNLDERVFKKIMKAGIDWITISFDGLGGVYEKIRYPAKYERAVEKIKNYASIKKEAGRVKPVIKVQSILPAIENDPRSFYSVFAPITDMVSCNPLIDFHRDVSLMPKEPDFVCPQIFQRLVIGANGLGMMCMNDVEQAIIVGDSHVQTVHEIWHGSTLSRVREIHKMRRGCEILAQCARCYLPLATYEETLEIGGRQVVAEKYVTDIKNFRP
jgi:pyruvate-formate lyase-activating enzyme